MHQSNNPSLDKIFNLLTATTGTDFSNYKPSTICRRLEKRMASLNIGTIEEYVAFVEKNEDELTELFNFILINVTNFFRDTEAFNALKATLVKVLETKKKGDLIRIWVVACATGEEAYSIAISLSEILEGALEDYSIQIFATDIDGQAIDIARKAIYPVEDTLGIPELLLEKYFIRKDDNYEIIKSVRALVLFSRHDVTSNPPYLRMDMISCRNLLIYFDNDLQKQIIPIFHYALNRNGYLFLGKSETIGQFKDLFTVIDDTNRIYQRKVGSNIRAIKFSSFTSPFKPTTLADKKLPGKLSIAEMAKETLFNTYEHPYVVIFDNYDIQEIFGDIRLFISLPEGSMNANILKLVNPELQIELYAIISRCIRERIQAKSDIRKFEAFGQTHHVRMVARPIINDQANNELFLVIFEKLELDEFFMHNHSGNEKDKNVVYNLELEYELATTKEYLQSFVEELESSNEALQILNEQLQNTNEELQSSVEELESSNEELQSTNEEIHIAYTDLKAALQELGNKERQLRERELELSTSREKYKSIIDHSVSAIILSKYNGHILEMNQAAVAMFGYTEEEFKQLQRADIFDLANDNLVKLLEDKKTTGKASAELIGIKKGGERFPIFLSSAVFTDLTSGEGRTCSVVIDITERKKVEELLLKSNERFKYVLKTSFDAIWDWDLLTKQIYFGEGFTTLFGHPLSGENTIAIWEDNLHPADKKRVVNSIYKAIESNKINWREEYRFKKADGDFAYVRDRGIVIRNDAGEAMRMIGAMQDITLQKEEEQQLKLLESAITKSAESIVIADVSNTHEKNHKIVYVNDAFEKITLYKKQDAIGESPTILLDAPIDDILLQNIRTALRKGEPYAFESLNQRMNGEEYMSGSIITPVLNDKGRVTHTITISRDITNQKKNELEREMLIEELTRTNKDLKQFSYITSHNLRAPLTNLILIANLLNTSSIQDEVVLDLIDGFKETTYQLNETLNDLIKGLIIKENTNQQLEELFFNQACNAVCTSISSLIQQSNTVIDVNFSAVQKVFFKKSYLESIFLNMITNAIKYAHPNRHPVITIRSFIKDGAIKLTFTDNGLGLDLEKVKDRIFNLYQRFHKHTDSKGIGLYLVHSQMNALGGSIEVESIVNKGTTFTLTFKVF